MNGDGGEWADPPIGPTTTYPHETGHVLGQYDEYGTYLIKHDHAVSNNPNLTAK
jgi:hypothetical protein